MEMPHYQGPRNWHKAHRESLGRGDKAADAVRNGMGSWAFVFTFVAFLAVWATLKTNQAANRRIIIKTGYQLPGLISVKMPTLKTCVFYHKLNS